MVDGYDWIPFYRELAEKLQTFAEDPSELFQIVKEIWKNEPLFAYLNLDNEEWWGPAARNYQIDPFSVFGSFNRKLTDANRTKIASIFADTFNTSSTAPVSFDGIPTLNNMQSFYGDVPSVWNVFMEAMAINDFSDIGQEFVAAFDEAIAQRNHGLANISMGLFWCRPDLFIALDKNSLDFIENNYNIPSLTSRNSGKDYVEYLNRLREQIDATTPGKTFPMISYDAWPGKDTESGVNAKSNNKTISEPSSSSTFTESEKNIILYGAPGTGKTYSTVLYAVHIIEDKPLSTLQQEEYSDVFARYTTYKKEGLIAFTTFHQSFGYEEFVEGIRPVLDGDEAETSGLDLSYEIHSGIFKTFCEAAAYSGQDSDALSKLGMNKNPQVWKVALGGAGPNETRTECFQNNHIRIGWDLYGEEISDATDFSLSGGKAVLNAFYNKMQVGDIVLTSFSNTTIDGIGIVTSEPLWDESYERYRRIRKVRWIVTDIREDITSINGGKNLSLPTVYKLSILPAEVLSLLYKYQPNLLESNSQTKNRVFIIDEINRGNISNIFGELITLLEPTKRLGASEEIRVTLPYSGAEFGVPENVYLLGTMNTADRSIALIDTALRRRFHFVEMHPEPRLFTGVEIPTDDFTIRIDRLLTILNNRISVLLDREHVIGHAYFLPLMSKPTIETLGQIFQHKVFPLLQEYFFDDYERIVQVLGDNQKQSDDYKFVVQSAISPELFGEQVDGADIQFIVQYENFHESAAYEFLS